jgi:hypothetical protein
VAEAGKVADGGGLTGANYVEDAGGRQVDLKRMPEAKRKALAARLLTPVRLDSAWGRSDARVVL